ncbi:WD40/YVTN/BNR-like repeat-containing protein [Desulfuromonas versatilis]|uniref:WD40/YVTN/BNR-like repeat-containing protein n=1 Tax=Desulfuromonas versatilis TaxID=2802975 RepID=UPI001C860E3B|nr:YCF48-related protein [Desulfuromonas versatilis]
MPAPLRSLAVCGFFLLFLALPARAAWIPQSIDWAGAGIPVPLIVPDINDVQFPLPGNDQVGYAVGGGGLILKTTDGGATPWRILSYGVYSTLYAVHFPVDDQTGFVVGTGGAIVKITNAGSTITNQTGWYTPNPPGAGAISDVYMTSVTQGHVVARSGRIYKTTDGGATPWVMKYLNPPDTFNAVHFPQDALTGYAVGNSGIIFKTSNAGETWTPLASGVFEHLNEVYFLDNEIGFTVGELGRILRTNNGGDGPGPPWQDRSVGGVSASLEGIHFPPASTTGFIVGTGGTVLYTTNGGANWGLYPSQPPTGNALYAVQFPVDANTGYVVGARGTIYKLTDATLSKSLAKAAFLTDGTRLASGVRLPKGTLVDFLVHVNNGGGQIIDLRAEDVLDGAFLYQGNLKQGTCSTAACRSGDESAIYTAIAAAAGPGTVVSQNGNTVRAGLPAPNSQIDVSANTVWGMVFRVQLQ